MEQVLYLALHTNVKMEYNQILSVYVSYMTILCKCL